ncbi:MAG TPA: hypothetical protein VFT56_09535 [Sphingomonas sp.]|nr:hypothetical protein [Sphingomonas sp.]
MTIEEIFVEPGRKAIHRAAPAGKSHDLMTVRINAIFLFNSARCRPVGNQTRDSRGLTYIRTVTMKSLRVVTSGNMIPHE